jgi:DNA end-binding protein Ku
MKILWKGYISFGLVNIPVRVHSADKGLDLHFHLLDSRDKSRIRFEKINEHTGEEVPWNKIVKAYQLSKNNYVIIKDEKISPKNSTSIAIDSFIDFKEINPIYFDKPYYLAPDEAKTSAYPLLHEALKHTNKVGIAKLTIRAREHIAMVYPYQNILIMQLLIFPQEIIKISEFELPKISVKAKQLNSHALMLAEKLIANMSAHWHPEKYHDESRERMLAFIRKKAKKEKIIEFPVDKTKAQKGRQNVIYLLEKSLSKKLKHK